MSAHSLHPPHTLDNLTLPDDPPELEHFFRRCVETREFQEAQSEREQVHLCMKWARENCNATLTLQQLADFFNLAKSTVAFHLTKPFELFRGCDAGKAGRPGLLLPEEAILPVHTVRTPEEGHLSASSVRLEPTLVYCFYMSTIYSAAASNTSQL